MSSGDSVSEDEFDEMEEEVSLGQLETRGLFSSRDRMFPSADACLEDARDTHGFDLLSLSRRLRLDCFGVIKLVNFIRSGKGAATDPRGLMESSSAEAWADQKYLKPVRPPGISFVTIHVRSSPNTIFHTRFR